MSSGGRFDISALQVIASVLAAVTGAIAASYLGIAGTIVGTAVMSVAGTAGSAIYRHYLGRGQEQLKNKAAQIVPKARDSSAGSALNRHRPATEAGAHAARPNGAAANGAGARAVAGETSDRGQSATAGARRPGLAAAPTELFRTVGHAGTGQPGTEPAGTGPDSGADNPAHTRSWDTADQDATLFRPSPAKSGSYPAARLGDTQTRAAGSRRGRRQPRPSWVKLAAAALAVFAIAMAAITVFELAAGKPLEAAVYGRKSTGTTLSHALGGHVPTARHHAHRGSRPSGSATPKPRASSSSASSSPSPSPTPTSSSPAPRGTRSASPSPSASATPTGSASPSSSASAR
ncbi:MAG: hypothetical protein ACLP52_03265 [Streptosporangiaceae bacterium]